MSSPTVLFIHGGKVSDGQPVAHFLLRLEAAVDYALTHPDDDLIFFVSGRWTNANEEFDVSEAELGKRWILERMPTARVYKEDVSVELAGNYAFSKPLLRALTPELVIVFTSELLRPRTELLLKRIFAEDLASRLDIITTDQSDNEILVEREALAAQLFGAVFADIADGGDAQFRDALMYKTPYYFKNLINDKTFFDTYWPGGFDHYLNGRATRARLG